MFAISTFVVGLWTFEFFIFFEEKLKFRKSCGMESVNDEPNNTLFFPKSWINYANRYAQMEK